MLRNYLQVAFRNLARNKVFAFINIFGLGVAIAISITAFLNSQFNNQHDIQHENAENIYRLRFSREYQGRNYSGAYIPAPMVEGLRANSPANVDIVRIYRGNELFRLEDEPFQVQTYYTDPSFMDVFTFPLADGELINFDGPSKILISESTAEKFFGEINPVGQDMTMLVNGDQKQFTVAGVLEKVPLNSSFIFDAVLWFDNMKSIHPDFDETSWRKYLVTFAHFRDGVGLEQFRTQMDGYLNLQNEARQDFQMTSFHLDHMPGMAVRAAQNQIDTYWLKQGLPPAGVLGPVVMGGLILLLACFNFTNTAISASSKRLKEIGIRKTLGGLRQQVIWQFLAENTILCFLGLLLGILLSEFLVPAYSSMWPYLDIDLNLLQNPGLWFFLIALLAATALLAAAYPAFYVSKFQANQILRGTFKFKGTNPFSMFLLWLQYSIAMMSVISAYLFYQNAVFQQEYDMGFNQAGIGIRFDSNEDLRAYRNAISNNPDLEKIGESQHQFLGNYIADPVAWKEEVHEVDIMGVGSDYLDAMNIRIKEGRNFIENSDQDLKEGLVINERMAEIYGWDNPLGEEVVWNDTTRFRVVGIVYNFINDGLWNEVDPMMMYYSPKEDSRYLSISSVGGKRDESEEYLAETWNTLFPDRLYPGNNMDDRLNNSTLVNNNILIIYIIQGLIAILISGTGLFTLVSLNIIRKTKEIGIRKVLGASIGELIRVVNQKFLILLAVSALTGSVMGYFSAELMMNSIWTYYVNVGVLQIIPGVLLLFLISGITLASKVMKAVNANPVDALRNE